MGKGDKKTKRGKIFMGSFGVKRPRNNEKPVVIVKKEKATVKKAAEPVEVVEIINQPIENIEVISVKETAIKTTLAEDTTKTPATKKTAKVEDVAKKPTTKKTTKTEDVAKKTTAKKTTKSSDEAPKKPAAKKGKKETV